MMLEEIMDYVHNYFDYKRLHGNFVISSGNLDCTQIKNGQYFRIVGSIFNDGVWAFPAENLIDEEFNGEVWLLAVPPRVISLAEDIEEWAMANHDVLVSPYQSESFGGYTYTKASGSTNGGVMSWRDVFGSQLNQWRKLS